MRETVIYIPELKLSFSSVAAAARAAGADPSNVGKVLRGKRKTASGYHFEYRWKKEPGRGAAIRELQAAIAKANDLIKKGKERRRFGFSKELQEIDKFRDFIGSTEKRIIVSGKKQKISLITASAKAFTTFSVGEMEKIAQKLQQRVFIAKKAISRIDEDIKNLASMLGLSFKEALEYDMIFPEFYRMLQLAAKDNRIGTNEMLEIEIEVTNAGASEAQMVELFGKLNRFFADPSMPREFFDDAVNKLREDLGISEDEFGNEDLF